jgi:hypothetical protein
MSGRKRLLHVLATTTEGTRCALGSAKELAAALDAQVVLLVPRVTNFGAPFDPSGEERATVIDRHHALAADIGVHINVMFCVCHRHDDVVHQMLGRSSLVVVGGRKRTWWPTREERLVSRLSAEGYPVVFAQVRAGAAAARAPLPVS